MSIFQAIERQIAEHQIEALDRKVAKLQDQVNYLEALLESARAEHKQQTKSSTPLAHGRELRQLSALL